MYCTQCGTANDEQATICSNCQAALFRPGTTETPKPQVASIPNDLVQSILVTLCCCQLPGLVAVVYAAQVNGLVRAGDFAAARRASRIAYIWAWVGVGLALVFGLGYLAVVMIGLAAK